MEIHPRLRALRDLVRQCEQEHHRQAAEARRIKNDTARTEAQRRLDEMTKRLREADEQRRARRNAWRHIPFLALPSKRLARENAERHRALLLEAVLQATGVREWVTAAEVYAAYGRLAGSDALPNRRACDHLKGMAREDHVRSITIERDGKKTTFYTSTAASAASSEDSGMTEEDVDKPIEQARDHCGGAG